MTLVPPQDRASFEIAIICALEIEADAIHAVFDLFWEDEGYEYGQAPGDNNTYTTGVVAGHNVVLAYMPGMGKVHAASVAASLCVSFSNIKLALVVGICGAMPKNLDDTSDIHLGDLIISTAVIQYDFGKRLPAAFEVKDTLEDSLSRPTQKLRGILKKLKTKHYRERMERAVHQELQFLADLFHEFVQPDPETDLLFPASFLHKHQLGSNETSRQCIECEKGVPNACSESRYLTCDILGCDAQCLPVRQRHHAGQQPKPAIHFGKLGSGDTIVRSGIERDRLANQLGVIAFEMEGAGAWDHFPSIAIVKGVSDYADSHKSKLWQPYAAGVAASGIKALLKMWSPETHTAFSMPQPTPSLLAAVQTTSNNQVAHNKDHGRNRAEKLAHTTEDGIRILRSLYSTYWNCDEKLARTWLFELASTKKLLMSLQDKCQSVDFQNLLSQKEMRATSLQIQAEDCYVHLEEWHNAYESRLRRMHRQARNADVDSSTRPVLVNIIRSILNVSIFEPEESLDELLRTHFLQFRQPLDSTISLHFTANTKNMDLMESLEEDDELTEDRRLAMRLQTAGNAFATGSSEWSERASSVSTSRRLVDLESIKDDLSDMVERVVRDSLQQALSAPGAKPTSTMVIAASKGSASDNHVRNHKEVALDGFGSLHSTHDHHSLFDSSITEESPNASLRITQDTGSLHTLVNLLRDLEENISATFEPSIVEYLIAAQEWQVMMWSSALINTVPPSRNSTSVPVQKRISFDLPEHAAKLLSLRRRALAEASQGSVSNAEAVLNIGDTVLAIWESDATSYFERAQRHLPLPRDSGIQRKDNISDWLLQQLFADEALKGYHKFLLGNRTDMVWRHEAWERQVIKYWFLDDLAGLTPGEYASTSFSGVSDTDQTILQFDSSMSTPYGDNEPTLLSVLHSDVSESAQVYNLFDDVEELAEGTSMNVGQRKQIGGRIPFLPGQLEESRRYVELASSGGSDDRLVQPEHALDLYRKEVVNRTVPRFDASGHCISALIIEEKLEHIK